MCLAIPARIEALHDDKTAAVDILGVKREIAVDLVPSAQVGDFVLVHAGYGIEVVSEQFARETIDLIREFPELVDFDIQGAPPVSADA
jgi:hydrogenase expression/formation protein HypC